MADPPRIALPSEPTILNPIPSSSSLTGESAAPRASMSTVLPLSGKIAGPSGPPSSVLTSHVDPRELHAQETFPRVLDVSEADIKALAQVIKEAHEQMVL